MRIDGSYGAADQARRFRMEQLDDKSRAKSAEERETVKGARETSATPPAERATGQDSIHNADALRAVARRLLDAGDIEASADGQIRPSRVDQARQNYANGAYDRKEVIARIVDRLMEQWDV